MIIIIIVVIIIYQAEQRGLFVTGRCLWLHRGMRTKVPRGRPFYADFCGETPARLGRGRADRADRAYSSWRVTRGIPFGCGSNPFWDPILGSVNSPPILSYFSGDWDVHWGYGILTRGHLGVAQS